MRQADAGIEALQKVVDTLIIIPNQNLFRLANEKTTFTEAFALADDVLYQGVKGVTDLMVRPGLINLDFADVRAVMDEMGKAMMGTGEADGENRAVQAAEKAIANPLLDEISLNGAKGVLINITGGYDLTLFELDEAANVIREKVDSDANIIVGSTLDEGMEGAIRVSVVATGIDAEPATIEAPLPRRRMQEPLTQNPTLSTREPSQAAAEDDELPMPPRRVMVTQTEAPRAKAPVASDEGMPEPAYRPEPAAADPASRVAMPRIGDDAASFTAPQRQPGQPSQAVIGRLSAAVTRPAGQEVRNQRAEPSAAHATEATANAAAHGHGQGRMGGLARMLERMSGHAPADGADRQSASSLAERINDRVASRRANFDEFDGADDPDRGSDPVEIPAFLRRQAN